MSLDLINFFSSEQLNFYVFLINEKLKISGGEIKKIIFSKYVLFLPYFKQNMDSGLWRKQLEFWAFIRATHLLIIIIRMEAMFE